MTPFAHLHDGPVWKVCWRPRQNAVASVGRDRTIRLSAIDSEARLGLVYALTEAHTKTIRCVDFDPTGRLLAACSFDGSISIWLLPRTANGSASKQPKCLTSLEGHENEVKGVAFSPTGRLLATCGRDRTVWLWKCLYPSDRDVSTIGEDHDEDGGDDVEDVEFECLAILSEHTQDVKAIVWNMWHVSEFCTVSYDETARIWTQLDMEDDGDWGVRQTIDLPTLGTVWSAAYVPPFGDLLIVAGQSGGLVMLRRANHTYSSVWQLDNAHDGAIYDVSCACVGDICMESFEEAKEQFSTGQCPTIVATCGQDRTIRLWTLDRQHFSLSPWRTLVVPGELAVEVNAVDLRANKASISVATGDDAGNVAIFEVEMKID